MQTGCKDVVKDVDEESVSLDEGAIGIIFLLAYYDKNPRFAPDNHSYQILYTAVRHLLMNKPFTSRDRDVRTIFPDKTQ